jgi:DNA-binding transcriptional LysR family regulator
MDVLTNLRSFLAVARYGGFSEAARQLHVVPSVAAKRVTQLEKTVGARLFVRSTRKIELTEAGVRFQAKAAELVAGFDDVVNVLKHDNSRLEGHIRVMVPTTLAVMRLTEVFAAFLRAHPDVSIEVALVDRSINPMEEGFDFAISGRSATYEGVVDVPLCSVQPVLCAAPSYLEAHGTPTHPRNLIEHKCLVFRPAGAHWQFGSAHGAVTVDVTASLIADDNLTLLSAARAGCGIAIVPRYVAHSALKAGELRMILPDYPPQENWFVAYIPRRKQQVRRVAVLIDWLSKHMQKLIPVESDAADQPTSVRAARARKPR